MHGDIVYFEFALGDVKATIQFYETLFHWTFEESFVSKQRYFMFKTPGNRITGGFDANLKAALNGVQCYVDVEDIDSILATLAKHPKASILKGKTLISKVYGYYALIKDPSGNTIGLQEDA